MRGRVWGVVALAVVPAVSLAGSAEDDLAVVKRAVAAQSSAAREEGARAREEAPARAGKMRWLKVRIVEKTGKRVSVNLPLSFARALGDDWPVNIGCRKNGRSRVTLGEVLRSLEAGQDLVQVDSDDATVRVWVE